MQHVSLQVWRILVLGAMFLGFGCWKKKHSFLGGEVGGLFLVAVGRFDSCGRDGGAPHGG